MKQIRKRILTDEEDRPIAVQVDYADWLLIEEALEEAGFEKPEPSDLSRYRGIFKQTIDPVEYQRKIRDEWS